MSSYDPRGRVVGEVDDAIAAFPHQHAERKVHSGTRSTTRERAELHRGSAASSPATDGTAINRITVTAAAGAEGFAVGELAIGD